MYLGLAAALAAWYNLTSKDTKIYTFLLILKYTQSVPIKIVHIYKEVIYIVHKLRLLAPDTLGF